MVPKNRVTLNLMVVSVIIFCGIPFFSICVGPDSAWAQGRTAGSGTGPSMNPGERGDRGGRGGPPGSMGQAPPGMTMPGMSSWGPYTPTDDEISRIMNALRFSDPNREKELDAIRKTAPQFFMNELRKTQEFANLMNSRIGNFRTQRDSDFLKWLGLYVPSVAGELDNLRGINAFLYSSRYELAWQKYSGVFDKSRTYSDPNYSINLVNDLDLEEQQNNLRMRLWNRGLTQNQRSEIESQLNEVVSKRYDINVEQKKIEYEQLLRQLIDLQALIQTKLEEIKKWGDPNEKTKAVEDRLKILTWGIRGIGGDNRGGGPGGSRGGGGRGGGGMGGGMR